MGDPELLEPPALDDRGRDAVAAVRVEAEPGAVGQPLADPPEQLEVLARVGVLAERTPVHPDLERPEAELEAHLDVREHLVGGLAPAHAPAPVERDRGPRGAPEQPVERQPGRLAGQIPERDVHRADDVDRDARPGVRDAVDEPVPVAGRVPRILADQHRADDLLHPPDRAAVVAPTELGGAVDALVGEDPEQRPAGPQEVGSDLGDLHRTPSWRRPRRVSCRSLV